MSQFRKTPDGMIDYDFYKKDANRLRREARNRFVDRLVSGAGWAICLPFRQVMRFAAAWQAAWPAAAAGKASDRHFLVSLWSGLAKARSLLW